MTTSAPAASSKITVTVNTPSAVFGLVTSTVAYGVSSEAQSTSATVASCGDVDASPPPPPPPEVSWSSSSSS
ncbi:hypothetical protein ADK41_15780 [Streptomyces caelestis]|uniref:Uncharacterized protein n=1 Tax=Streptomyces caelestis TaxID=36816 RepID=A0A0M8QLP2_9ACTN|nr:MULTISPECIES: hypothetical protein [Streptomyces]KOT38479.1 hypothetical protein ADK41_15780 [Streptomyces caelestis]